MSGERMTVREWVDKFCPMAIKDTAQALAMMAFRDATEQAQRDGVPEFVGDRYVRRTDDGWSKQFDAWLAYRKLAVAEWTIRRVN